jgi:hypothetical protein
MGCFESLVFRTMNSIEVDAAGKSNGGPVIEERSNEPVCRAPMGGAVRQRLDLCPPFGSCSGGDDDAHLRAEMLEGVERGIDFAGIQRNGLCDDIR